MKEPRLCLGKRCTVATMAAVAVLASACSADEVGSSSRPGSADRLPGEVATQGYRVTYRVHELDERHEEHIVVRRPYESRRTLARAGEIVAGTLTNTKGLWHWVTGAGGGWQLVDPGRRHAAADPRPLVSLPLLVQSGLATVQGTDRVAGRPCVLVRTAEPIGSPVTAAPTDEHHDELCLDRTGVVLRETWVIDGRTVRRKEAVEVTLDPPLEDREFEAIPAAAPASATGKESFEATDDVLTSLEVGFDLSPDVTADGADAWLRRDPLGGVADASVRRFYRRGDDLADVEERETAAVSTRRNLPISTPLGQGFYQPDLRQVILHVPLRDGVTVIVRASSMELVRDLAKAMARHGATPGESAISPQGRSHE